MVAFMQTDLAHKQNQSFETYVIEIDGVPRAEYHIFVEALHAGLQLKHDFPRCSVKLRDASEHAEGSKH
jgi:hypothetical protein